MRTSVTACYRLQLRPDALTFADAAAIADYLQQLGISHLYLSPVMTAMRGSTHGYDVADPATVAARLGGPAGFQALADHLRRRGMGLIVDLVPNHVGVADPRQNRWWWHVLEHGRASRYAGWFDIDWSSENGADGLIALPVLDGSLDPSALAVDRTAALPVLTFGSLRLPIAAGTDHGSPAEILGRQFYRLVDWRSGIGTYRRFFAVNELAAVRQENPAVFQATHRDLIAWCAHGLVDGVRVDHPDGLAHPADYLRALREVLGPNRLLWIEKILAENETLDPTLPVDGTTGYDALAELGGVLLDPDGEPALAELAEQVAGTACDAEWHAAEALAAKRDVARTMLAPELRRLVAAVRRDTGPDRELGDDELTSAVVELVAATPVYRTDYAGQADVLGQVVVQVERRRPELRAALGLVVAALCAQREAAVRFPQMCGAVMAKAVEDRLFYRSVRLVSLAEVGGDPARFGRSVSEFHVANARRAHRQPAGMTTVSTHDTKRGEDVRARIGVLSQLPQRWAGLVTEWLAATPPPDGATGLFLLQNMVGIWPADGAPAAPGSVRTLRNRLHAFAEKAVREASVRTSWRDPDPDFELEVHAWVDAVLDGPVAAGLDALTAEIAPHGWSDALAQKLLQLCGPGIPDVYQGTELWEDSLVDPDNRRLVDFTARAAALRALTDTPPLDGTGAAKMWVTAHALWLRRERPAYFVGGTYVPMAARGPRAEHLVAFARGRVGDRPEVIAAATRLSLRLADTGWQDTACELPPGAWTDRLSGRVHRGRVTAAQLFAELPVALLAR